MVTHIPTLTRMAAYSLACKTRRDENPQVTRATRAIFQVLGAPSLRLGHRAANEARETPFLGLLSASVGYTDCNLANRKTINFTVLSTLIKILRA